jgi:ABC-2 type transport system ATP-binding protein
MVLADRSIVAQGLVRRFEDMTAVAGIDLDIGSGRIFGFLGPNGSGKSTTVKMLTTILAPTSGTARVAGFDVTQDQGQVRACIGVALQEVGLDSLMTPRELLRLQAKLFGADKDSAREAAGRLLDKVGLGDLNPKKRVGQLSGGMKRRLDLALALVNEPDILFLDEPTTGLDPASRLQIWEEVRRLNRQEGMTIFLTTQYLEEADRLADEVAVIDKGKIVAQGSPSALKKSIGNEVVTLSFASAELAGRAAAALRSIASEQRVADSDLLCYFAAAADKLPRIVRTLDEADIPLQGLRLTEPTLDDVFLRATGERLAVPGEER